MYMLYVIMHSITLAITEKELLLPRTFAYNMAKQVKKLFSMCMCKCCEAKDNELYSQKNNKKADKLELPNTDKI